MRHRAFARLPPLHGLAPLIFIPLALLFMWPLTLHPNWVAYPPGSNYTDLVLSHLPNAAYWREAIVRYGQWPLWNGQIFAGQPFAADPLAGIWYPPALILLVLPLPFGLNLLMALHVAWGGYGLFRFLSTEGLARTASALGAVAFAGTPKLLAHLGAGHVSLVCAVAWSPWLLLAVRRAATLANTTRWNAAARGALAGAIMAIVFLADVRWAFYAGLLALGLGVAYIFGWAGDRVRENGVPTGLPGAEGRPNSPPAISQPGAWSHYLVAIICFGLFFLMLCAVLALPLVEFVRLSNRSALTLADAGTFSLPPLYFLGLLIPDLRGFHEWMTYLGAVPLLLAVAGCGRRTWFWVAVALVAAAYSLGTNFVLFPSVFRLLPLAGFLRVPPRAWLLVALAAAILAAHGLQRLLVDWLPLLARRYAANHVRLPSPRAAASALLVFTVLDLMRVDGTLLEVRPMPVLPAASAWISQQPGVFRVYSPSLSLPYGGGLQHVDGVDPLQLSAAVDEIGKATGVITTSYSVTVPPFASDDLATANASAKPSPERLAALDVKYIAAEFDLPGTGFEPAQTFGRTRVFLNRAWTGRAWVEGQAASTAMVTFWSPNRVEVQATGPGRLVLSEIAYPGWLVRVDGLPARLENASGALRSVQLATGSHSVSFEFQPISVYLGAALSAAGLIALTLLLWSQRRS